MIVYFLFPDAHLDTSFTDAADNDSASNASSENYTGNHDNGSGYHGDDLSAQKPRKVKQLYIGITCIMFNHSV